MKSKNRKLNNDISMDLGFLKKEKIKSADGLKKNNKLHEKRIFEAKNFQKELETRSKVLRFKQVESQNFITFKCPDCKRVFGLNASYLDGNCSNVHYFCPHCGETRGLED